MSTLPHFSIRLLSRQPQLHAPGVASAVPLYTAELAGTMWADSCSIPEASCTSCSHITVKPLNLLVFKAEESIGQVSSQHQRLTSCTVGSIQGKVALACNPAHSWSRKAVGMQHIGRLDCIHLVQQKCCRMPPAPPSSVAIHTPAAKGLMH